MDVCCVVCALGSILLALHEVHAWGVRQMFIIHKGAVDVVSEDGSQVFATMAEGAIFGEISLFKNCPRTASIRSKGNCDLFVLSKQDLDEVLQSFPDVGSKIMQEAALRFEKVCDAVRGVVVVEGCVAKGRG